MYTRDLEDLSMLVTSRAKDAHVHMCVWTFRRHSVQEYSVPPLALPQLLHIVPKTECSIMEHLLTATNTFSNDVDRNTNIYTCNNHGCHEPQQIDYIVSSDHREPSTHQLLHQITGD